MQTNELNATGEWGEIYACRYLRDKGVQILASNYRCRFGEADIICTDTKHLIVVEVKSRNPLTIAAPREFVTEQKQKKLALTVADYLSKTDLKLPVRFDVAEVIFNEVENYQNYKINYLKDAFRV